MDKTELAEKLAAHKEWLLNKKQGKCADFYNAHLSEADLRGADLRGADLRGANLGWADLREANLGWADLSEASLREASLREADLHGADLRGADLRKADLCKATGFVLLPVQDVRGYSFAHAVLCDDGWRIRVGCRDFTIDEALEHWGDSYEGDREQGDLYLYAVNWLKAKLENER